MSAYTSYSPGDHVRLKLGDEIGLAAEVVAVQTDAIRWQAIDRKCTAFKFHFGKVCVEVPIGGIRVPMAVEPDQLEPDVR
jgi:hypothetical protein